MPLLNFKAQFVEPIRSAATPAKGVALIPADLLIRQLPGGPPCST